MADEARGVQDWELLAQFAHTYRVLSDAFMDKIDMHRSQSTVLCKLFVQDGQTQSELAGLLSVQGATMTEMLQRMEEAGYVARRRDPDNNRLVRVYLTDLGREKERSIAHQFVELEDAVFANFKPDERELLRRLLNKAVRNMNDSR